MRKKEEERVRREEENKKKELQKKIDRNNAWNIDNRLCPHCGRGPVNYTDTSIHIMQLLWFPKV